MRYIDIGVLHNTPCLIAVPYAIYYVLEFRFSLNMEYFRVFRYLFSAMSKRKVQTLDIFFKKKVKPVTDNLTPGLAAEEDARDDGPAVV